MKRIPGTVSASPEEIEDQIKSLQDEALDGDPKSHQHRAIMRKIARLRIYAEAKRWLRPTTAAKV